MSPSKPVIHDGAIIEIADNGVKLALTYEDARAMHKGDSWWGVAVGFRAMQVAAQQLSQTTLWDRNQLDVVSGHPGPGVIDAIDYVTGAVERKRFRLTDPQAGKRGCSRDMKYEWWVSDETMTVAINLRPDFVPEPFYELLDRLGADDECPNDQQQFDAIKLKLEARIWREPIRDSFQTKCLPTIP